MRKNTSHSSRDSRPGGKGTFKKDDGRKPFDKDSKPFKKNYDGRGPSAGSSQGDKPYRSSKPYSGRVADGEGAGRPAGDRKPFGRPAFDKDSRPPRRDSDKPSWEKRDGADRGPRKEFDKPRREDKKWENSDRKPRKEFDKGGWEDKKRDDKDRKPRKEFDKPRREFDNKEGGDRPPRKEFDKPRREFDNREKSDRPARKEFDKPRREDGDRKPFSDRPKRGPADRSGAFNKDKGKGFGDKKPRRDAEGTDKRKEDTRPFRQRPDPFNDRPARPPKEPDVVSFSKDIDDDNIQEEKPFKPKKLTIQKLDEVEKKPVTKKGRRKHYHDDEDEQDEDDKEINQKEGPRLEMPLNKYIAHSGECSRRDAADMVKQGKVKVNGELVLDPGYRVKHDDKVTLSGKKLTPSKGFVYILLNKPKGFITTNEDPQGRKTVMELVASSGEERIYPVGRLDRDTSGLLLMTNDGELTQKLSHPSYNIKKVYHVTLDKPLTKADFEKVVAGVELEDGKAIVDEIAYLETKNELGLEIHSGRNRIVRRIFESMGYVVDKLDRVMYAGLTKKNLPRSKWRYLNDREIVLLKHFKN